MSECVSVCVCVCECVCVCVFAGESESVSYVMHVYHRGIRSIINACIRVRDRQTDRPGVYMGLRNKNV